MDELKSVRGYALDFIGLFYNSTFKIERDTNFAALATEDYSFIGGDVIDGSGYHITEKRYRDYLENIVIPYSEAMGYDFEGKEFLTGALARMNINRANLHADTKTDVSKFLNVFPSKNVYHNNLAQAIEIVHCIDH